MELIGRYVNLEGEFRYFQTGTQAEDSEIARAVRFVEQPINEAIRAANNAVYEAPCDDFGFFLFLDEMTPAQQETYDATVAAGKAESRRRGQVSYSRDKDGLTWDAASWEAGLVKVEIFEEGLFAHFCAGASK